MDLVNVERQAQNDTGAKRAIRLVMIQKREALKCIEREIAQLAENKRGIEEDLVRLGVALGPHDHSLFPNEILSRIFVFLALGYGFVMFPIRQKHAPPQLVVSHVCSHWRMVALRTPELWSHMHLVYLGNDPSPRIRRYQRWLLRARTFPVTLSIDFSGLLNGAVLTSALQKILLPIQVKKLSLQHITHQQFMALATLPEATLSGLSELEMDLMFPHGDANVDISDTHPLITRLRSVAFAGGSNHLLHMSLPWSQLRRLTLDIYVENLGVIFGLLRQMPMLEVFSLVIYNIGVSEQLTMSALRDLTLELNEEVNGAEVNGADFDKFLRSFMCPSLTELTLISYADWTSETFEILKQQYNIRKLHEVKFRGQFSLPVSSILSDAPMLRSLSLGDDAIMDDEAVMGVSNGTLGRFLRRLEILFPCDVGEVLGMLEARKKTVDGLIENNCSWREGITVLKDVAVLTEDKEGYEERVIALKKAGIAITFW